MGAKMGLGGKAGRCCFCRPLVGGSAAKIESGDCRTPWHPKPTIGPDSHNRATNRYESIPEQSIYPILRQLSKTRIPCVECVREGTSIVVLPKTTFRSPWRFPLDSPPGLLGDSGLSRRNGEVHPARSLGH